MGLNFLANLNKNGLMAIEIMAPAMIRSYKPDGNILVSKARPANIKENSPI